jgi:hypothetical protein
VVTCAFGVRNFEDLTRFERNAAGFKARRENVYSGVFTAAEPCDTFFLLNLFESFHSLAWSAYHRAF